MAPAPAGVVGVVVVVMVAPAAMGAGGGPGTRVRVVRCGCTFPERRRHDGRHGVVRTVTWDERGLRWMVGLPQPSLGWAYRERRVCCAVEVAIVRG